MKNKRGWLRVMEATIAILLVSGVMLVMYSSQVSENDLTDEMYVIQRSVLEDISLRDDLRTEALKGNETFLNEFADSKIIDRFNQSVRICNLSKENGELQPCKLDDEIYIELTRDSYNIYTEEIIVSASFGEGYNPKKVVLSVWEVRNN